MYCTYCIVQISVLFCNGILYFYWFRQDTQIATWTLFSFQRCKKVNINYVKYILSYCPINYFTNFIKCYTYSFITLFITVDYYLSRWSFRHSIQSFWAKTKHIRHIIAKISSQTWNPHKEKKQSTIWLWQTFIRISIHSCNDIKL